MPCRCHSMSRGSSSQIVLPRIGNCLGRFLRLNASLAVRARYSRIQMTSVAIESVGQRAFKCLVPRHVLRTRCLSTTDAFSLGESVLVGLHSATAYTRSLVHHWRNLLLWNVLHAADVEGRLGGRSLIDSAIVSSYAYDVNLNLRSGWRICGLKPRITFHVTN
jgi:hypothetical protein